jgi:flagellar motor switch protein FliN/FliY
MTSETEHSPLPDETGNQASPVVAPTDSTSGAGGENSQPENIDVTSPDFQEVSDDGRSSGEVANHDLKRFQDIKVVVSADLGRATVPLQTLMNLGEGSVLELNREIDSPVELVAQGVPLASGEVVVVNGCFAIRITKVYENQTG